MDTGSGAKGAKKTWLTDGRMMETASGPREVRLNKAWYQSPLRAAERRAAARSRIEIVSEEKWNRRANLWPDANYDEYVARKQRQLASF